MGADSADTAAVMNSGTRQVPPMSEFTTLRVGGSPAALLAVDSREQAVQTFSDLDDARTAYVPFGGGSNLVVADAGVPLTMVWLRIDDITVVSESAESVRVDVGAGVVWDDFVAMCSERGWSGVEALSGIPGSVGATPIQNVGAYGAQVADVIESVQVWDRTQLKVRELTASACGFGYRDSALKRSRRADGSADHIVLSVTFALPRSMMSAPIRYAELAAAMNVNVGERAEASAVRAAVLQLRAAKGMVLKAADHDTWSVGSFFVNPTVSTHAAESLPTDAPRWQIKDADSVKLSAAWLVEHAGFAKGFALPGSQAALSTKHALAITNRGEATAEQVIELARAIRAGVLEKFAVQLEVEPTLLGVQL